MAPGVGRSGIHPRACSALTVSELLAKDRMPTTKQGDVQADFAISSAQAPHETGIVSPVAAVMALSAMSLGHIP